MLGCTRCWQWTSTATRSSTYSMRRRRKKPCAALGVAGSSSTASISSMTPSSRASSRCRIWLVPLSCGTDLTLDLFLRFFFSVICAVLHFFTVALLLNIFSLVMITNNLAAICTPADYHTRPLDTIFSNFIDALPVVSFETPGLLGIAQKTTSAPFTSQHVKCMGKR
ncbi:hypothetical protein ZIOFF_007632 [Zingiber officinale]|uniref:Uncharacterized protein n=1 Tax=Zingiber officinale TaxID=94328 RepID=A0A8J5LWN0_ZINOF|nr:hypothetical protein ZIOFF_007632 [Zingiber officinale]